MRILFLIPYPVSKAPSQRFRFEQYFEVLEKEGHIFDVQSFIDVQAWQIIYKPGKNLLKTWGILKGFILRFLRLFIIYRYDFIFIHREATPLGPPIFEWIIAKVWHKKIIYDFDDAIWLPNTSEENILVARLKWHNKVSLICKWSHKVSCGNHYLCDYARQFNSNVVLNPTTIDTENWHNPALYPIENISQEKPVIGWTGTHSTLPYLDLLVPVLQELEKQYDFTFLVIANKVPELPLKNLEFKHWNKETEIGDLLSFDIGLMPLSDDIWAQGKCGFKALQYMALEIPAVVSPIGINCEIIEDGVSGFLCRTAEEWYLAIEQLILDPCLREKLGMNGREKVVANYSVISNASNFLGLFH